MIEARDLVKRYGSTMAVNDLSFSIPPSGPAWSPASSARMAVFYTAVAQGAVFEGAHLEGADFRQADLKDARFTGAWLEGARFAGAKNLPVNVAGLLDKAGQVGNGKGMPVPAA